MDGPNEPSKGTLPRTLRYSLAAISILAASALGAFLGGRIAITPTPRTTTAAVQQTAQANSPVLSQPSPKLVEKIRKSLGKDSIYNTLDDEDIVRLVICAGLNGTNGLPGAQGVFFELDPEERTAIWQAIMVDYCRS